MTPDWNRFVTDEASESATETTPAPVDRSSPNTNGPSAAQRASLRSVTSPSVNTDATNTEATGRQLRADLKPVELKAFLAEIDREMRALINGQSGITDAKAAASEAERVVRFKLAASQRLIDHRDSSEADRVAGRRGFLQSLSHLAAMGDLKSAEQLQEAAERYAGEADGELKSDSQLVLIGFAIESLRHGKEGAAERVLELLQTLMDSQQGVDVAALMVMGQAKDALLQYEHGREASRVRDLILQRFGSAKDPEVARMAAMIASSGFTGATPALDQLEQLRQRFVADAEAGAEPTVRGEQWRAAIEQVFAEPVDVLTIEFLAGVSLEAEAIGRADIAEATYEQLAGAVSERDDAVGQVAQTALRARENRRRVIGQKFDPDLRSVDGQPLKMTEFQGKVVLMPFWSSAYPESLAVLPELQEIQNRYPDQVAIVGLNLDIAGTDVQRFMKLQGISIPSFRSESNPGAEIVNEAAYRFGAVTLLFVAILDQDGRVVAIDFSGRDLTEEVEKWIR